METTRQLLTLPELARRLKVSSSWLRGESDAGRSPYLIAGRRRLYSLEAVQEALLRRAGACPGPGHDAG